MKIGFLGLDNSHPFVDAANLSLLQPGLEIVLVEDRQHLMSRFHQVRPDATVVKDVAALLAERVDGVIVTLRPSLLEGVLPRLVAAGIPVFINKQGIATQLQLDAAVRIIGERSDTVMTSSVLRYAPGVQRLARSIDRQSLLSVRVSIRHGIDHWLHEDNAWQADPDDGGGVVGSLGYHGLDIVHEVVGGDFEVVAVTTSSRATGVRTAAGSDSALLTLRWADGLLGVVELNTNVAGESYQVALLNPTGEDRLTLNGGSQKDDGFGYRATMARFLSLVDGEAPLPWETTLVPLRASAAAHSLTYGIAPATPSAS
jgi:predicted dehydrogenase